MRNQQIGSALCALATLGLVTLGLAACGGGAPEGPAVTVTVTPTVTASAKPTSAAPRPPAAPKSDVAGRGFDFGTITGLKTVAGVEVMKLDRWTFKGLDDARLAREGVPLAPFTGTPFENQNDRLTYAIPVAENARILYHHCVAAGEPQQTRSATVKEIADLGDHENLVLVRLDPQGRATALDNLPGCPG